MKEKAERNTNHILVNLLIASILAGIIAMLVVPIVVATSWYRNTLEEHQKDLETYSYETYDYLFKSVSQIFREDEWIIEMNAKPDDIVIEKIAMQDDGKFICKLYKKVEQKKYFPDENITAELSEQFEILSISSPYASEEEFVKAFKTNIENSAKEKAFTICLIEVFALIILLYVPYAIRTIIKSYKRTFQQKK